MKNLILITLLAISSAHADMVLLDSYANGKSATVKTTVETINGVEVHTLATSGSAAAPAVQYGSGVVTATTQRVTLATDGPSVVSLSSIAANTAAATPAGENFIGAVGGRISIATATFTRPADTTAYASGDLVANSTAAGSVTPLTMSVSRVANASVMIRRVRLTTSSTSIANAAFRVHFYRTSPTSTNGDNGVWLTTDSTYLGSVDVTLDRVFSNGANAIGTPNTGSEINCIPASGTTNIFALIEARGAYTPTSGGTFTLAVEALQN